MSSGFVGNLYYKEYNCSFLECLKSEDPFHLMVTEKANKFYQEILNYLIIETIVFGALLVLLSNSIRGRL